MEQDSIVCKRMTPSDLSQVLEFLHDAYPDTPKQSDPEFWKWHFLDHPNSPPGDLPVWLAWRDNKIIGHLGTIPVDLNVRGENHPASWIIDIIIDPNFRRR